MEQFAKLVPPTARTVCDLGTGSGCLLLSLLGDRPAMTGVGVDRSEGALAVARRNRERLHRLAQQQRQQSNAGWDDDGEGVTRASERAFFVTGDWMDRDWSPAALPRDDRCATETHEAPQARQQREAERVERWRTVTQHGFDVVVANPPYIPAGTPLDPDVTLYASGGGLDRRDCVL